MLQTLEQKLKGLLPGDVPKLYDEQGRLAEPYVQTLLDAGVDLWLIHLRKEKPIIASGPKPEKDVFAAIREKKPYVAGFVVYAMTEGPMKVVEQALDGIH